MLVTGRLLLVSDLGCFKRNCGVDFPFRGFYEKMLRGNKILHGKNYTNSDTDCCSAIEMMIRRFANKSTKW